MSAFQNRPRPAPSSGFTLVESILAVVVGIVILSGAAFLYDQARINAGTARAQEKVMALQQLVEEYASANDALFPSATMVMNTMVQRRTDLNLSPWGGPLPPGSLNGTSIPTASMIVADNVSATGSQFTSVDDSRPAYAGELGYFTFSSVASLSMYDYGVGGPVTVQGYAVWNQGRDGNQIFTEGGKP